MTFTERIAHARRFAIMAHGKQKYGSFPYVVHLDTVRNVAFEYEIVDEDILIATLLHDTLEDTLTSQNTLQSVFGARVSRLVWAVTNAEGKNRKERSKNTYPKIVAEPGATTLKLCDRIANVRSCWNEAATKDKDKANLLGMYKKEYGSFRKHLMLNPDRIEMAQWSELDRLLAWRE